MTRSTRHILTAIGLVAVVYLVTLKTLPPNGLWIVDNANKFLQVEDILRNPHGDFSIHWPGQVLDPAYKYNPMPLGFSFIKNGKLFSFYSPVFAFVSAWSFRLFGFFGMHALPLASSLLMLAGLAALANAVSKRKHTGVFAVLIGGLCTPVWFYSVVFWEHALSLCLSVWSSWFCIRFLNVLSWRTLVIGSALSALSAYFRDDQYLFCVVMAFAVSFAVRPGSLKVLAITGLTMLGTWFPLWYFQYATLGTALYHINCIVNQETGSNLLSLSTILGYIRPRRSVLYNLFFASCPSVPTSLLLATPFILLFLLRPSLHARAFSAAMPLAGFIALSSRSGYWPVISAPPAPLSGFCNPTACCCRAGAPPLGFFVRTGGIDGAKHSLAMGRRIGLRRSLLHCRTRDQFGRRSLGQPVPAPVVSALVRIGRGEPGGMVFNGGSDQALGTFSDCVLPGAERPGTNLLTRSPPPEARFLSPPEPGG